MPTKEETFQLADMTHAFLLEALFIVEGINEWRRCVCLGALPIEERTETT